MARYLLLLLVAFGALMFSRPLHAQALVNGCTKSTVYVCETRQQAYQQAVAVANYDCQSQETESVHCDNPTETPVHAVRPCDPYCGSYVFLMRFTMKVGSDPPFTRQSKPFTYYLSQCPAGTEWFDSLQSCDKSCSARNADLPPEETRPVRWATYDGSSCNNAIAECKYSRIQNQQQKTIYSSINGQQPTSTIWYGGIWGYTGERCSNAPPPADPNDPLHRPDQDSKPDCTPAGSGQTYCIKPNGDNCYTSSSGRSICWRPGEQGVKTDKNIIQENKPGDVAPNPPPGTTTESSTKVVTTSSGNQTTNTVNNYGTSDGSSAGTSDSGEATDGNGVPGTTGGAGEDDDDNASTGGGSCDSPPVSSGDALLAQIARQAWETRCVIANRDAAQDQSASDVAALGDGLDGVHESDIYDDSGSFLDGISEDLLGGNVSQCSFGVPLELMGRPIPIPPAFWDLARWIGFLTVALAYLWVARQLAG